MSWPFRWPLKRPRTASQPPRTAVQASGVDWAGLPPIQRTAGDIELTAEPLLFAQSRAGAQPPELALQPLGHERSLQAPAGLFAGLATHVQHATTRAGMPLRAARTTALATAAQPPERDEPLVEADFGGHPLPERPAPPELPAPPEPRPVMAVAPAATLAVAPGRLTSARPPTAQRTPEAAASPLPPPATLDFTAPGETPPPPRRNLGQSRRLTLGTPSVGRIQRSRREPSPDEAGGLELDPPPVLEPVGADPGAGDDVGPPPPDAPRTEAFHEEPHGGGERTPSVGPQVSPPEGMAAPIFRVRRRSATVQRATAAEAPPDPLAPPPVEPRPSGPQRATAAEAPPAPPAPPPVEPRPSRPQRAMAAEAPPDAAARPSVEPRPAGPSARSRPPSPLQERAPDSAARPSEPSSPTLLPRVRAQVVAPSAAVQRLPAIPAADPASTRPVINPLVSGQPVVARKALATSTAPAAPQGEPMAGHGTAIPPALPGPASPPPAGWPAPSLPIHPGQAPLAPLARPALLPVQSKVTAGEPLTSRPPAWPPTGPSPIELSIPVLDAGSYGLVAQRQAADDLPAPAPEVTTAPPSPGSGAETAGRSDHELDELAHQLYDRFRSRIRAELLVDRERAGLVTDLR